MLHQLAKRVAVLLMAALAAACGGSGGGGGSKPAVQDAAVGGLWEGQTNIAGQGVFELIGIIAEDGTAYFLQEDGVMYWGKVTSSGNSLSSTLEGAGILGIPLWDGSASGSGSATGTINARTSIAANSTFTTALGSKSTASIALSFYSLYDTDSSLALIAGNYVDSLGLYAGVLNIAGDGVVFLQNPDTGCVINGQVAIINPSYNAYDVRFSYSSCTGSNAVFNGATFQGLATYDPDLREIIALVQGTVSGAPYADVFIFDAL